MTQDITNYPLHWPVRTPRTPAHERKRAQFGNHIGTTRRPPSIAYGARALEREVRLLGGTDLIISTNLKVKGDGLPYSNQRQPDDPGVAVYFKWHDRNREFSCDTWTLIEDNLWAIVKHIESMRGQDRWGVGTLDQAFEGYAQLNDPDALEWWEVLRIPKTASNDLIQTAYRALARIYHPDVPETGDAVMFDQITKARDLALPKERA